MGGEKKLDELMEASEAFWDGETTQTRQSILTAIGFESWVKEMSALTFKSLTRMTRRSIARQIGGMLTK